MSRWSRAARSGRGSGSSAGEQGRPLGSQDAQIELGVEEGDLEAVAGGGVAMRLRDAMDEPFEPQPAQVVGHLGGGVRAAEQRFDLGAQVAIAEAARQMGKAGEGLEERHHARVTEAKRGRPLSGFERGALEPIERVLRQHALVADAFDFEELAIDLVAEVAEMRQIRHRFGDVEIRRVVDRGFRAEGALLFEVLLDVRGLVLDVQTGLDAIGDDAGAVAPRRGRRPPRDAMRKQQADPVGSPEVQILANDRFEEVAALHGTGKHLREADLHLLQREPVGVAGGAIGRGQRRRQPRRPAIEERLHVGRPELIADRLQTRRRRHSEKAVVETVKGDVRRAAAVASPTRGR